MKLRVLHEEIDARVSAIVAARPDWPCRRGCDDCCRSLAEPPRITADEWSLLAAAIEALAPERRRAIDAAFAERLDGRLLRVCPLLEGDACSVYAARPIACRTYGFYAARDGGRWCGRIEAKVADGECEDVVLGNQDAVEACLPEPRSVLDWYRERFGV